MTDCPVVVTWPEADHADIPDLRGCTADGRTPEHAPREVLIGKEIWLEVAREHGRPLPVPSSRLVEVAR